MNLFWTEISTQPNALSDTNRYLEREKQIIFEKIEESIHSRNIEKFLFTGIGSSYFVNYIPYYYLNQKGTYSASLLVLILLADFPNS
ncbi:MAG: hypothetical protein ACOC4M_04380 [Promethearchaeia archaeon]